MQWPVSISGTVLYPLTRDGFQVELEQQTLWLLYEEQVWMIVGSPVYDQRWVFPTKDGRRPHLIDCFKKQSSAIRALAALRHIQVNNLILEISKLVADATLAEEKERNAR